MFDTFIHHVYIDESRLSRKTCSFDLQLGGYQDQYRMTNVRDVSTSSSTKIPTGLTADIDYVTDRMMHVQLVWRPESGLEWFVEKFFIVWGVSLLLVTCALSLYSDHPLYGLLFPVICTLLWFGQFYFVKKRATKRYARDLVHTAYPLVMKLRQESMQVENKAGFH